MPRRSRKRKAVEILWRDSAFGLSRWTNWAEFGGWTKGGSVRIRTVGILARETKRDYVIVQNASPAEVSAAIVIPKACVARIKRLR